MKFLQFWWSRTLRLTNITRLQLFLLTVCYLNRLSAILYLGHKGWIDIATGTSEHCPGKYDTYQDQEHGSGQNHLQRKKGSFKCNAKTEVVLDYFLNKMDLTMFSPQMKDMLTHQWLREKAHKVTRHHLSNDLLLLEMMGPVKGQLKVSKLQTWRLKANRMDSHRVFNLVKSQNTFLGAHCKMKKSFRC